MDGTNLLSTVLGVYGTRGHLIGGPLHRDALVQ